MRAVPESKRSGSRSQQKHTPPPPPPPEEENWEVQVGKKESRVRKTQKAGLGVLGFRAFKVLRHLRVSIFRGLGFIGLKVLGFKAFQGLGFWDFRV